MDTVVFLQRTMGVDPDDISWVVPNDVWMLLRNNGASPYAWAQALVEKNLDFDKAALLLEKQGAFVRLDKTITPTRFRFPVVGKDELGYLQKVKNIVRRGRVTAIVHENVTEDIRVEFGPKQEPWNISTDHIFVHCTSPGPFNGNAATELFVSDKVMNLFFLFAPPVPISMSCLAMLESARRKGTLDLEFGRKIILESGAYDVDGDSLKENDILRLLVTGYNVASDAQGQIKPLKLLALFLALMNKDPLVSYNWIEGNRLSFFSIPGFKGHAYEDMYHLANKYHDLEYSENDAKVFSILAEKLKPLEGK